MRLRNLVSASDLAVVQNPKSFAAQCQSADEVGQFVYSTGPKVGTLYQVARVDITDLSKMPAVGVITHKTTPTTCSVQWIGELASVYTGMVRGNVYFIDEDARISSTPPVLSGRFVQRVGTALDEDVLLLVPNFALVKRN